MKRPSYTLRGAWRHPRHLVLLTMALLCLFVLSTTPVLFPSADSRNIGIPSSHGTVLRPATRAPAKVSTSLSGSPKLDELIFPFGDLCRAAEALERHRRISSTSDKLGASVSSVQHATERRLPQQRKEVMNITSRFDHVPATGGASAERWSGATGLPMKSDRVGEVKVRFVTASNRLGPFEQTATTAAAMVGARFTMLGLHWKHFSYLKRMGMMLSYAEVEGLKDSDVIVGLDSDALFSGEDPYSLFEAFVASTAESLEEHRTYSVRDIRFGKRLPPVVFGAEFNCMRKQALRKGEKCESAYSKVNDAAAKWSRQQNVTLPSSFTEANPFRLMNTGVFVARVWALRLFDSAAISFMTQHLPRRTNPEKKWIWMCDQSAMTSLFLDLLLWEILSGALDGTSKPLTEEMLKESVYPPMLLPKEGDGPNGLPGGLVGIDTSERLALTVGPELSELQFYRLGPYVVTSNKKPEVALRSYLASVGTTQVSVVGVPESTHRINVKPRNGVDCAGVADRPVECAYRDAVLGIPAGAPAVVPLLWHFAGKRKETVVLHYRTIFPWYTPTVQNGVALRRVVETLLDAPPTRVFAVDNATDVADVYEPMKMLPHNPAHDLSFLKMCTRAEEVMLSGSLAS